MSTAWPRWPCSAPTSEEMSIEDSDLDVLVDFQRYIPSLLDLASLQRNLSDHLQYINRSRAKVMSASKPSLRAEILQ